MAQAGRQEGRIDAREVRARVSLLEVASADVTWDRRRSNARRGDWWACCPFHQEKTPSFHVDERKGRWYCFGCGRGGDVIAYVRERDGVDFRTALMRLAEMAGLAQPVGNAPRSARQKLARKPRYDTSAAQELADEARRIARARAIWRHAKPAAGTPVEAYLRGRGISLSPPESLRYHPRLWRSQEHGEGPAMVAVMAGPEGRFGGVHRTWIAPDNRGGWRKAPGEGVKKMLGAARGAAVRLTPAAEVMWIAEGIETSLAVMEALQRAGQAAGAGVWAALSLGNMGRVWLPPEVREVVLVADNDMRDWRAGRRAVREAARLHAAAGRVVRAVWPPRGMDFLDWMRMSERERAKLKS